MAPSSQLMEPPVNPGGFIPGTPACTLSGGHDLGPIALTPPAFVNVGGNGRATVVRLTFNIVRNGVSSPISFVGTDSASGTTLCTFWTRRPRRRPPTRSAAAGMPMALSSQTRFSVTINLRRRGCHRRTDPGTARHPLLVAHFSDCSSLTPSLPFGRFMATGPAKSKGVEPP
jgi:hypothetical protein